MVKVSGLLVAEAEQGRVRLYQQTHMVEVELEHQGIVLRDHLLVVEMLHIHKDLMDFKIPVVAVEEVKEFQDHPIHSIQVVEVAPVLSSSLTILDKYLKT
jgi:hypothetical protein